ncbi:MAG: molybdopterin-dependent oxidoreductase, partial [Gammaproteobacteria bacterium]|nr:molybdopterin-dependent oxidoreductase [Gammaproteobacteria bacterium]
QDVEPDIDCSSEARKALDDAHLVIALTPFKDGTVSEYADIMLPTAAFSETSGTFINVAGTWQSFRAAVAAKGEARPGWKILRVLGNLFDLPGYDYVSSEEVRDELQRLMDSVTPRTGDWPIAKSLDGATGIANVRSIYQVDPLVRRAKALQATLDGRNGTIAGEQS